MSTQYPGGFITKSPVAPTTTAASGIWTVDQALQYVKAGTWPTPPLFIEELFSTYLYTGNGSTQTITNGIDLAGKGGMVWIKDRSAGSYSWVVDTNRGFTKGIKTQTTGAEQTSAAGTDVTAFLSTGFSLGPNGAEQTNTSADNFVSWTFRKEPKFFDVVTYTGTGVAGRTVSHNLGSVPGCMIVRPTSAVDDWFVYHRSLLNSQSLFLNLTAAASNTPSAWNSTTPTSTEFTVGTNTATNANGVSYVAYLFAHNAGGFPANGGGSTDGISCGSFVTSGTGTPNATITLGYEPQWVMVKKSSGAGNWTQFDNMRGLLAPNGLGSAYGQALYPNLINAEGNNALVNITPTGFVADTGNTGETWIYIAIRRGPMKTPTVGTSVLGLNARTGTSAFVTVTGGLTDDLAIIKLRSGGALPLWATRLIGNNYVSSGDTSAENAAPDTILQTNPWDVMDGIKVGSTSAMTNASTGTYINYLMRRAPGFMDVVCYAGINPSITHNLGVTPEMYIVKCRSGSGVTTGRWYVYHTGYNTSSNYIALNTTDALIAATIWGSGPTSSVIGASGGTSVNAAGQTYIAYLFATLAGISKVGSYTGTGALQTVNCGFTTGARFVLIKRTDSTGDWYTYDSARGMSSGTDPYFWMDSTAAENATTNYVDTDTTGFKVTAAAPAELNAVGGNYIFLAIA